MKKLTIDDNKELEKLWDCVVIGSGPAGAIAARQIASQNKQVLLIDKAVFPRSKVCGSCLNGSAEAALRQAGLDSLLADNQSVLLNNLLLFEGHKKCKIALPASWSLSRERFDMALVDVAIDSGVRFLPEATARVLSLEDLPSVQIQSQQCTRIVKAKIIVVADGLAGRSLELHARFNPVLQPDSRFGAGVILKDAPDFFQSGQIYMACGAGGYVGLVRLEDGRLDIAAAFDRNFSRDSNGPACAAMRVLSSCNLPVPPLLSQAPWLGTGLLTRKRIQTGGRRLFIIGDACGYSEPFTGEGMAWALWSGLAVASSVVSGIDCWDPVLISQWDKTQKKLLGRKLRSRIVAMALRHDLLRPTLIGMLSVLPAAASPLVHYINGSKALVSEKQMQSR